VDPLLLEALRFGVAILAGGIVAVIAQRIAFAHAQRLQRDEREHRESGLRRALLAELDENIARIAAKRLPGEPVVRAAWDAARGLEFSDAMFDALASAYGYGARYTGELEVIAQRRGAGDLVEAWMLMRPAYAGEQTLRAFRIARARLRGEADPAERPEDTPRPPIGSALDPPEN
jgi:hypothetical protein